MLVILSGHKFKFVLKFGPWAISTTTSHKIVEETRKITSTFNYIKTKEQNRSEWKPQRARKDAKDPHKH